MTDSNDAALIALVGTVKDDIKALDKKLEDKTADLSQRLGKVVDDHEQRIRKLERWQYVATGLAAALGSGIGASVSQLSGH